MPAASDPSPSVTVSSPRRSLRDLLWPALTMLAVVALAVVQLRLQGRVWWCACGQWALWWGDVNSPHNSQHPFDPYSFTHILHGVIACGVLALLAPRLATRWQLCLVVAYAALWEVFENTDFVIDRYRAVTMAYGYRGDSIANSLGDILSCAVGFLLARRLGLWWSVALFVAIEVMLLLWIRDSLLLNIVMLIHPFDAIKAWQGGG
jgi:hypothetical protein